MFYLYLKFIKNLLSVGQLLDKGYKVLFENKQCLIKNASGKDLFNVKMKEKSFALNSTEKEHMTFLSRASATEIWHKTTWALSSSRFALDAVKEAGRRTR